MGLTETSLALAGCVLLLVVAVFLDRRPYRPGKLSYIPLMIIALAAILVLGRHLVTLIRYGPY
jgi:flagellar biosynthesis protein FliQ